MKWICTLSLFSTLLALFFACCCLNMAVGDVIIPNSGFNDNGYRIVRGIRVHGDNYRIVRSVDERIDGFAGKHFNFVSDANLP